MTRTSSVRALRLAALSLSSVVTLAWGQAPGAPPPPRGIAQGTGTVFQVSAPGTPVFTLRTASPLRVVLTLGHEFVSAWMSPADGATSTAITLTGFPPGSTQHRFVDSFRNDVTFVADDSGSVTWTQDIVQPRVITVMPHKGTIYLTDSGWDPPSTGTWDPDTRTATLTTDPTEWIQISASHITLDGAGHEMLESRNFGGPAIYLQQPGGMDDVTIRNLRLTNWGYGVHANSVRGLLVEHVTVTGRAGGSSSGLQISGCTGVTATENTFLPPSRLGIVLSDCTDIRIERNVVVATESPFLSHPVITSPGTVTHNRFSGGYSVVQALGPGLVSDNEFISEGGSCPMLYFGRNANTIFERNLLECVLQLTQLSATDTIRWNTIRAPGDPLRLYSFGGGAVIYNNTIESVNGSPPRVDYDADYQLDLPVPVGGNYWGTWTGPDVDGDGFVDTPYAFGNSVDHLPYTQPEGWMVPITVTAGPGGTATPSGILKAPRTTDRIISITPGPGYAIGDVVVDGVSVGPVATYTFTRLLVPHTLVASFVPPKTPPTLTLPDALTVNEGDTLRFTALATDPDLPPDVLTFSLLPPSPAGAAIDPSSGAVRWPSLDDDEVVVRVQVDDGAGGADTADVAVTVKNVTPAVTITAPASGALFPTGTTVALAGGFADCGLADTHTATWSLDAVNVPGSVSEPAHSVAAAYRFTAPGVYLLTLAVQDDDGGIGTATTVGAGPAMVVVYDPTAGFVTASGWFGSPTGALTRDPAVTGNVHIGLVAKYKSGASVPTGEVRLRFKAGDLDFSSSAIAWLVLGGGMASVTGAGTVNGQGAFGFQVICLDGDLSVPPTGDKIRAKIWETASGLVVYDSQQGAPMDALPTVALGGGSVAIHTGETYQRDIYTLAQQPGKLVPAAFALHPVAPNPFEAAARIAFDLPVGSRVRIAVMDAAGRKVVDLLDDLPSPGNHFVDWAGRDRTGQSVGAGIYFIRFEARPLDGGPGFEAVRRVVRMP